MMPPSDEPTIEPPAPARFANSDVGRYHMRRHFDDLRIIERVLIAGKLVEGKSLAYLLLEPVDDPGMSAWQAQSDRVMSAVRDLTHASSVDDALRLEARVAEECASCHIQTQSATSRPPPSAAPADRPTAMFRMARHIWATDRLWEGVVYPSDERWASGLAVLATTPLPYAVTSDAPALAAQLQRQARAEQARVATGSLDDRAIAYGEMLVTCAACHSSLRVDVR
jgi:mono/diheme cytochrome c family protein